MIDPSRVRASSLVMTTVKIALAVTALSVVAAEWLASRPFDQDTLARLAAQAGGPQDPVTTGALKSVKLDPCAAPKR